MKQLLAVGLFVASGMLAGCGHEPAAVSAAAEPAVRVAIVQARRTNISDWLEVMGTVQAQQTSQIAGQVMGRITAVRVKEGDRVRRGDLLLSIEDARSMAELESAGAAESASRQQIAVAESNAQLAEATFKRYQELYLRKSVSPQEFDEISARRQAALAQRELAQAGLTQASAAKAQAETALGYTRLRAPFDGVITHKFADEGSVASPGTPLLTMEDTRRFRLEVPINETDVALAKLGARVPVTLDAFPGAGIEATVAQVVPAADSATRTFVVKLDLPPDRGLRSGLFGRARFDRGERKVIAVPRSAVVDRGQLQAVYVVGADQVASLRYITLGRAAGDQVEVLSGLSEGERFVSSPGPREFDGRRVEAQ